MIHREGSVVTLRKRARALRTLQFVDKRRAMYSGSVVCAPGRGGPRAQTSASRVLGRQSTEDAHDDPMKKNAMGNQFKNKAAENIGNHAYSYYSMGSVIRAAYLSVGTRPVPLLQRHRRSSPSAALIVRTRTNPPLRITAQPPVARVMLSSGYKHTKHAEG